MVGVIFLIGFGLVVLVVVTIVFNVAENRRLRHLAEQRRGESICTFVRSLDYRRLDTTIIRAVYEGFQEHLRSSLPPRSDDDIDRTYRIDREDLDDLAQEIAERCGRRMDGWDRNPFFGRVETVSDLIEFFNALPKGRAA